MAKGTKKPVTNPKGTPKQPIVPPVGKPDASRPLDPPRQPVVADPIKQQREKEPPLDPAHSSDFSN